MDFFEKHEISRPSRPYTERDFNSRIPRYNDDSDYTTNAPSYYDDLARKNQLMKTLSYRIWEYQEVINKQFNEWDEQIKQYFLEWQKNLDEFDDEVLKLLKQWLLDGTLDHIINETLLNMKADKTYVDDELAKKANKNNLIFNVKEHGALGNGVNDDTEHFKTVISLVENIGFGTIFIPKGEYILTEKLEINNSNVNIIGENPEETILHVNDLDDYVLDIRGSLGFNSYINASVNPQENSFTVNDLSGFNVGDKIMLTDDLGTWELDRDRNYRSGQLSKIISVSNNQLILDNAAHSYYNMRTSIQQINTINVTLKGFQIKRDSVIGGGITARYTEHLNISNIIIDGVLSEGISTHTTFSGVIENNTVLNHGHGTNLGYGVTVYNSINIKVKENIFFNGRRGVDISGSIPSRFITVSENTASNQSESGFGSHASCQYCHFLYNRVTGWTSTSGLDPRGKDNIIKGNYIESISNGIVQTHIAGSVKITDNIINGKNGEYWTFVGIRIFNNQENVDEIIITDNVVDSEASQGCIRIGGNVGKLDRVIISDNVLNTRLPEATRYGVHIDGSALIGKLKISENSYNVYLKYHIVDESVIDDLIIYGIEENGVNYIVESGNNVNGNYVMFGDGTMIAWKRVTLDLQSLSPQFFDFPKPFAELSRPISSSLSLTILPSDDLDLKPFSSPVITARYDRGWGVRLQETGVSESFDQVVLYATGSWKQ